MNNDDIYFDDSNIDLLYAQLDKMSDIFNDKSKSASSLRASSSNEIDFTRKIIPSYINYNSEIGPVHNQKTGSCYAEAATGWIEQFVWRHTGEMIKFSRAEIHDIGADSQSKYYDYEARKKKGIDVANGGWSDAALKAAYKYNNNLNDHYFTQKERSSNCQKFKNLIDSLFGKLSLYYVTKTAVKSHNIIKSVLAAYGPTPYACYWYGNGEGPHEIILCGYDDEYVYCRNSWGQGSILGKKDNRKTWDFFTSETMPGTGQLFFPGLPPDKGLN